MSEGGLGEREANKCESKKGQSSLLKNERPSRKGQSPIAQSMNHHSTEPLNIDPQTAHGKIEMDGLRRLSHERAIVFWR